SEFPPNSLQRRWPRRGPSGICWRKQRVTSLRANAKQSTRMIKVWIASSRSLSSGAHSRDPLAHRNYESGANHAMKNLLTDISGIRVGHADNPRVASGATAVI